MKRSLKFSQSTVFVTVATLGAGAYADPCTDIANDTVAEIRAGAGRWWTDDLEQLVRSAAGSACVKAMSGRYSSARGPAAPGAVSEEAIAAGASSAPATAASSTAQTAKASDSATAAAEAGKKEDDGSWSFGGLTFRSMSGSPSKKPYERNRQKNNEEDSE